MSALISGDVYVEEYNELFGAWNENGTSPVKEDLVAFTRNVQ